MNDISQLLSINDVKFRGALPGFRLWYISQGHSDGFLQHHSNELQVAQSSWCSGGGGRIRCTFETQQIRTICYGVCSTFNNPTRPLRSSSLNLLRVPFTAKAIGRKASQFAAPTVRNSIPQHMRLLPSVIFLKRSLKTQLFSLPA